MMNPLQRILHRPFFIKLLHWEYWNMTVVYGPIYPIFAGCASAADGNTFLLLLIPGFVTGDF